MREAAFPKLKGENELSSPSPLFLLTSDILRQRPQASVALISWIQMDLLYPQTVDEIILDWVILCKHKQNSENTEEMQIHLNPKMWAFLFLRKPTYYKKRKTWNRNMYNAHDKSTDFIYQHNASNPNKRLINHRK